MTDGYLSARHAAEFLDMSYAAFDQAVRRLGIPCKKFGRLRRFRKADLERVMDAMSQRPRRKRAA